MQRRILFDNLISAAIFYTVELLIYNDVKITYVIKQFKIKLNQHSDINLLIKNF